MTGLEQCLPPKLLEGTLDQRVEELKKPEVRARIRKDIETGLPGWGDNEVKGTGGWHGVLVAALQKPENKKYEGQRMDEIARIMGEDPLDALCDLLISEGGSADAIYFSMSEADVEFAMKQSWVGVGSDGIAASPEMTFLGKPHPRFYGTFPRVLGVYVRERHVLTLPDAVRKMTSLGMWVTRWRQPAVDAIGDVAKQVGVCAPVEEHSRLEVGTAASFALDSRPTLRSSTPIRSATKQRLKTRHNILRGFPTSS